MPKGHFPAKNNWTADQVGQMDELLAKGLTDTQIGSRLGRSATAIQVMRKRRGLASRTSQTLNCRKVAAILGVGCAKTVQRWIALGWLKGRRGPRRGPNRQWVITEEALYDFLEDPRGWVAWSPERITDAFIASWAGELRKERYLRIGEVAERFCVHHSTVNQWIHSGHLPALDYGNWWIAESSLRGFVPPCNRSKVGLLKPFTPTEDRVILSEGRHRGASWKSLAALLGRTPESVHARWYRLQAAREAIAGLVIVDFGVAP